MKIIITERQLNKLSQRRNFFIELSKYITSTFEWLNPKAFANFDEFLERVIFSATRDFAGSFIENPDEYEDLKNIVEPMVRDMVINQYYQEILDYYTKNR